MHNVFFGEKEKRIKLSNYFLCMGGNTDIKEQAKLEGLKARMKYYYHGYIAASIMLAIFLGILGFLFGFNYEDLDTFLSDKTTWIILFVMITGMIIEIVLTVYYYMKFTQLRERLERGEI